MAARLTRRAALGGLAGALAARSVRPARAAEKLRVGKAVSEVFGYVPLDIGMKYGIFEKNGIEIEEINFAGGTKMAQAVIAGAVDIALSAGPEMALVAKGVPEKAIATITDSAAFMGICVGTRFTGQGIDSLKGRKIGITTSGSLTEWLVEELNRTRGWTGSDCAVAVAIGGSPTAAFAALKVGQIDADVGGTSTGYQLQELNEGRLLIDCSQFVNAIELFTIYASDASTKANPGTVRRFLKAWFESLDYMKGHKAESIPIAAQVTGFSAGVMTRMYDTLMDKFSTDGRFQPQAIASLEASFAAFKTLPEPIDMSKLYTEEFLPKGSRA